MSLLELNFMSVFGNFHRTMRSFVLVSLSLLALATAQMVFPGRTWTRQSPQQAGFDRNHALF